MKRIKCLSALLALTFLFCVGTVDAQVKKIDAKQQKLEYKTTSDAKKSSATQTSTKQGKSLKNIKVVSTQVGKTNAKPAQLQGTGSTSNTNIKKTNNLQLAPVHGAKTHPVSPVPLKGNVSTNKKATSHVKLLRKAINRPD